MCIRDRAIAWRANAERTFLKAYEAACGEAWGSSLLPLFLAEKLLHEIAYEGTHRPVLLPIPVKAALAMLEPATEREEETVK